MLIPRLGALRLSLALTCALSGAAVAAATPQSSDPRTGDRAPVQGTVRDQSGLPVPGAAVILRNRLTGGERIVQTSNTGTFTFPTVSAGEYELVGSLSGFLASVQTLHAPASGPVSIELVAAPYQDAVTVVSADRGVRSRETAGVPVTVVDGESARDAGLETVGEVLRGVGGVITRRGSEGTAAAGEQIQGIDSRQVLVLLDGQPVVGARGIKSGVINLDRESVSRLDRVEVVKGAASAVYGSDAIGGVINLITRDPRRPLEAAARASGGSRGLFDAGVDVGGLNSKGTLFASVGRHQVDSFDLTPTTLDTTGAELARDDVSFHGRLIVNPAWQLSSTVSSYWNTQTGRSVGELGPEEDRVPANAQTYGATADWQVARQTSAQFRAYYGRYSETTDAALLDAAHTALAPGELFQGTTKLDASVRQTIGDRQELRGGIEYMHDEYSGVNRIRDAEGDSASTGVGWAQYTVTPLAPLTVSTGVRLDDHSTFGTAVSPKVAVTYRPSDSLSGHVSFGRGFRAPDLGQLYYQFVNPTNFYQVIGNPNLEPERSTSWQIGADVLNGSRARLGINWFHNDVTNLIESTSLGFITSPAQLAAIVAHEGIDPGFNVQLNRLLFIYKNITHARTEGVELEGDVRLPLSLRVGGGYTYLDAVNTATGLSLTGRNPHQGSIRADWVPATLGLRANLRAAFYSSWVVSRSTSGGQVSDTVASRFALWDASVSKTIAGGVELFGAIDNLTDSQDPNTGQLAANGTPLPIYRPEIGRTYRGGLRWGWSK